MIRKGNILFALVLIGSVPLAAQNKLPDDVELFAEKRDGCDHFRGEYPYNEERKIFLLKNITELCTGTDVELSNLKEKYKDTHAVMEKLSSYEEDIEPGK